MLRILWQEAMPLFLPKDPCFESFTVLVMALHGTMGNNSGGFRGQVGATAPLHDENSALAPPFWQEKRPIS